MTTFAELVAICLVDGHDWKYSHDIWVVCERCGVRTPGSIDDETIEARKDIESRIV